MTSHTLAADSPLSPSPAPAIWQNRQVDRELIERFRSGEESAIKTVYERFGGAVFTVAMSILRDRQLAADVTQTTFLKAWKAAATYDPDREMAPWIYAIARRSAIDLYRKHSRIVPSDEIELVTLPPDLERAWEAYEVRLALDQLPDAEREVLRLAHYDGLSQSEIATDLGIPLGTVKSRTARAYERLNQLLRHMDET